MAGTMSTDRTKVTRHLSPAGELRWYFANLDETSDFHIVRRILTEEMGAHITRIVNRWWFIKAEFERDGDGFVLYWDDDLGVFLVGLDQEPSKNQRLEELVQAMVPHIERHLGSGI
jgi:hypothetical protein